MEVRVRHEKYGEGVVVGKRFAGLELRVTFDYGATRWVRRWELRVLKGEDKAAGPSGAMVESVDSSAQPSERGQPLKQKEPAAGASPTLRSPVEQPISRLAAVASEKEELAEFRRSATSEDLLQPCVVQAPVIPSETSEEDGSDAFSARRIIEAFRLGIVPEDCVGDFIYGRDTEIAEITAWLHSESRNVAYMVGPYGSGKSHFLDWLAARALTEGFVVAKANIDPVRSPFHQPKTLWAQLTRSLRYLPKGERVGGRYLGFEDLIRTALDAGFLTDHRFFGELEHYGHLDLAWDWIGGHESVARPIIERRYWSDVRLPGLYGYATAANLYTFLLTGLSWAAKQIGKKGLLVMIDEAEGILMTGPSYQWQKSLNVLGALTRAAADDPMLEPGRSPLWETGLDYCRVGPAVPFVFRQPAHMKLVLAFTHRVDLPGLAEGLDLELSQLNEESLLEVYARIGREYRTAFGDTENGIDPNILFEHVADASSRTRMYVKACVEALDLVRFNPGVPFEHLLR